MTARVPAGNSVRGSSTATVLASILGENEPIPNLVAGTESFNVHHPLWCSGLKSASIDDLKDSLSPGITLLGDAERDSLENFFAKEQARAQSRRQQATLDGRLTSRHLIDEGIADLFDTNHNDLTDLNHHFGVNSGINGGGGPLALMAYQALTNGISRCVTFRATSGLDSHGGDDWRNNHGPRLMQGFNSVAALAQQLDATPHPNGGTWLDRTIVCQRV